RRGKQCYLPVMRRDGPLRLLWRRHRPGMRLRRGRYGILEPRLRAAAAPARALDLVLLPLVGFDARGNRMGMGKGFYDRTFAFRRRPESVAGAEGAARGRGRPRLLGLAHDCQRVDALPAAPWDVPLDAVATPRGLQEF